MKALLLASLLVGTSSVFAQITEFGVADCNVTVAGKTRPVSFKIAAPALGPNAALTTINFRNNDGSEIKVGFSAVANVRSNTVVFSAIAKKAVNPNAKFVNYSGTVLNTATFPIVGNLVGGVEERATGVVANASNINFACKYSRY